MKNLAFTLAAPDGNSKVIPAISCGVERNPDHTSRCWQIRFEVETNNTASSQEYMLTASSTAITSVRTGSLMVSRYPRWERDAITFAETNLTSTGPTIASVVTQDDGRPAVETVMFTTAFPTSGTQTKTGTSCGVTDHGDYVSRCWETHIDAARGATTSTKRYSVEAFSPDIRSTAEGVLSVVELENRSDATLDSSEPITVLGTVEQIIFGNGVEQGIQKELRIAMTWRGLPSEGANIAGADLTLYVANDPMEPNDSWKVSFARALTLPPVEVQISWAMQPITAPPASVVVFGKPEQGTFVTFDVKELVQQAVDAGTPRVSMVISVEKINVGDTGLDSVGFRSRDVGDPKLRPRLLVQFF